MEKVSRFIKLLLNAYEVENIQKIITECEFCYSNSEGYLKKNEADWLLDIKNDGAFEFCVTNEIFDYLIVGDKIDEIHELLEDEIDEEFPYEFSKNVSGYFKWVDNLLDKNNPQLSFVEIGDSYSDNLQLILICKEDMAEIKELCLELHVHFEETTNR
jgi:hypothetical protein